MPFRDFASLLQMYTSRFGCLQDFDDKTIVMINTKFDDEIIKHPAMAPSLLLMRFRVLNDIEMLMKSLKKHHIEILPVILLHTIISTNRVKPADFLELIDWYRDKHLLPMDDCLQLIHKCLGSSYQSAIPKLIEQLYPNIGKENRDQVTDMLIKRHEDQPIDNVQTIKLLINSELSNPSKASKHRGIS